MIHGSNSKCVKGPYYDLLYPQVSLHMYRDRSLHDLRRRVWSAGFSDRALRDYEERTKSYRNKLLARLFELNGQPTDVSQWLYWYSFDVMGDLAFGESFKMLDTAKNHWATTLMEAGILPLALLIPMWLLRLGLSVPGLSRDWWLFLNFSKDRLLARMAAKPDVPDMMSALLAPLEGREPTQKELDLLIGDAQLIVGAGRWVEQPRRRCSYQ